MKFIVLSIIFIVQLYSLDVDKYVEKASKKAQGFLEKKIKSIFFNANIKYGFFNYYEAGLEYERHYEDYFFFFNPSQIFYFQKTEFDTLNGLSSFHRNRTLKLTSLKMGIRKYINNFYISTAIGGIYCFDYDINSNGILGDKASPSVSFDTGYKFQITKQNTLSIGIEIDYYWEGILKDKVDFNYLGNSKITQEEEYYKLLLVLKYHFK